MRDRLVEDAASVVPPEVDISVELVSFERATVTALIRMLLAKLNL